MEIRIAENIRKLRKSKSMTQEQLACAFGVTVGAVSKWESGSSVPDIAIIMEMAAFFGVSTDYLLGYIAQSEDEETVYTRLKELRDSHRFKEAVEAAEQAIARYPNNFKLIHYCAVLFALAGTFEKKDAYFARALELYNLSLQLLTQNTDPKINEWTIKNDIAHTYMWQGKNDIALEKLKENNAAGINADEIGRTQIFSGNYEEGLSNVSYALFKSIGKIMLLAAGYIEAYIRLKKYDDALHICDWTYGLMDGLRIPGKMSYFDETIVIIRTMRIWVFCEMNDCEALARELRIAYPEAMRFDAAPDHGYENARHFLTKEPLTPFIEFAPTLVEGIDSSFDDVDNDSEVYRTWQRVRKEYIR
ncbi:MAG: helix-turn-helix domain-containing protein [Lachnospiraceae bacterium]|nr:helix-turn-helix domain-containing protein [Lachnospiraceae bacterium]